MGVAFLLRGWGKTVPPSPALPIDWTHPLAQGLVGCYLPHPGGAWYDRSGKGNHGTLTNGPVFSQDGLLFAAGSDQYVNCGADASLNPSEITLVASYRLTTAPTGAGVQYMVAAKDIDTPASNRPYTLDIDSANGLRWYINGGGGSDLVTESRVPVAGDDRVVAGSWDVSKALRLYVNGVLVASGTTTSTSLQNGSSASLLIGRRQYAGFTSPIDGLIRYVFVFNRSLSAAEIEGLYIEPYSIVANMAPFGWGAPPLITRRPDGYRVKKVPDGSFSVRQWF